MKDDFEKELAALRREVAEFVVEILRSERDGKLLDEIADNLAQRLDSRLELSATLDADDLKAIADLKGALRARPGVEAPDAPFDPGPLPVPRRDETASGDSGGSGGAGARPSSGLLAWLGSNALLATVIVVIAIIAGGAMFVFLSPSGQSALKDSRKQEAAEGTAATASTAVMVEERWRALVAYVDRSSDAAKRSQRLKVLCGADLIADCPMFEARRAAVKPGAEREEFARTLAAAAAEQRCDPEPNDNQPVSLDCILGGAPE